jgi:hypothetical protein
MIPFLRYTQDMENEAQKNPAEISSRAKTK